MLDVLDIHTHTTASGHAYNTIYEMAQSASRKGLALLGISDHGPAMEGSASKHYFRSSRCIPRELYGVKILFGCELNIMDYDGGVDLDEVFAGALDYGIASLHDVCITPGSRAENTRAYLKAMAFSPLPMPMPRCAMPPDSITAFTSAKSRLMIPV